jgi:hypothetical protein
MFHVKHFVPKPARMFHVKHWQWEIHRNLDVFHRYFRAGQLTGHGEYGAEEWISKRSSTGT